VLGPILGRADAPELRAAQRAALGRVLARLGRVLERPTPTSARLRRDRRERAAGMLSARA